MTQKNTAVIYCRVSTEDQSTDRQERDLRAFAKRAGYKVIEVYKEKESGTKDSRTERNKILTRARQRAFDTILVTELTRWGRSTTDLLSTLQELNNYSISVVAQSGSQFDLNTAQGKMIAGVLAVLAQFERDLISERTKSGLAAARARGKKLGRQSGDCPTQSRHTKEILQLRQDGITIREVARRLNISTTTVQRVIKSSGSDVSSKPRV